MGAEITVPGTHRKVNKWVAGGVLVGGLGAAWLAVRKRKGGGAGASSSAGTVTDPGTGAAYPADGADPATGQTYGQEISAYGSVAAADAAAAGGAGAGSGLYDQGNLYGTGYDAAAYYGGGYGSGATISGSVYTTDSTWSQAVTAGLQEIGYTGTQIADALGAYLAGKPLTPDEARIIQDARAEFGKPPSGDIPVIQQPGGNTGGTPAKHPAAAPAPTVGTSASELTVAWSAIPGATKYEAVVQGPEAGIKADATVTATHAVFSVASSGDTGTVKVRAGNSAGWGPYSSPRNFKFVNTAKPKTAPVPRPKLSKPIDSGPAAKQ